MAVLYKPHRRVFFLLSFVSRRDSGTVLVSGEAVAYEVLELTYDYVCRIGEESCVDSPPWRPSVCWE